MIKIGLNEGSDGSIDVLVFQIVEVVGDGG